MDGIELLIYLGTKIVACQKEGGGGGGKSEGGFIVDVNECVCAVLVVIPVI